MMRRRILVALLALALAVGVGGIGAYSLAVGPDYLRAEIDWRIDSWRGRSARLLTIEGVEDIRMFLDPESIALTPIIVKHGIWEPSLTAVFLETLRPGGG